MFGRVETIASGEGGSLPPQDPATLLPLDIQYLKAVDWLVERRVVNSFWQKGLRVAQAKLEAALEAERPPVAGIDAILPSHRTQEGTTYFECAKVLAMLKEAGMDEKSFLGAFTNPHTARWADVVKKYESGNVFLVDTAQYLIQHTSYELPALKKELGRAEREQAELLRRQADFVSMAEASRARYAQACAKKHMRECEREGIRAELRRSLAQLRPLYDRVARLAQHPSLVQASEAYKAFVLYAVAKAAETAAVDDATGGGGGGGAAAGKGAKGAKGAIKPAQVAVPAFDGSAMLPVLTRLLAIDLERESLLAEPSAPDDHAGEGGAMPSGGIDWGGGAGSSSDGAAIEVDWGGDSGAGDSGSVAATIEVDWGGDGGDSGAPIEVDWGGGGGAVGDESGGCVDWGIGESAGDDGGGFAFEIEVAAGGEGADDEMSLAALFEQPASRNQLIDDLLELQAFFTQSAAELKVSGAVTALPLELQLDAAEVEARVGAVDAALAILEDDHTKHLLLLGTSDQYLERQAKQLEQMLDTSDKMSARAEELQFRKDELASTIRETHDKYAAVVGTIQKAKGEFEQALSAHFGGRRVNLMGDINSI